MPEAHGGARSHVAVLLLSAAAVKHQQQDHTKTWPQLWGDVQRQLKLMYVPETHLEPYICQDGISASLVSHVLQPALPKTHTHVYGTRGSSIVLVLLVSVQPQQLHTARLSQSYKHNSNNTVCAIQLPSKSKSFRNTTVVATK